MRLPAILLAAGLVWGCAGPPLTVYTLQAPPARMAGLPAIMGVVAVARVAVPDAVDSQDILVRQGAVLRRSATGRWATRLSLGVTDLMTARLAARYPDALVTDQPQAGAVTARVDINIDTLDVAADGSAVLSANWTIIPADPKRRVTHDRARIVLAGSAADDAAVVVLLGRSVVALADRIVLPQ